MYRFDIYQQVLVLRWMEEFQRTPGNCCFYEQDVLYDMVFMIYLYWAFLRREQSLQIQKQVLILAISLQRALILSKEVLEMFER